MKKIFVTSPCSFSLSFKVNGLYYGFDKKSEFSYIEYLDDLNVRDVYSNLVLLTPEEIISIALDSIYKKSIQEFHNHRKTSISINSLTFPSNPIEIAILENTLELVKAVENGNVEYYNLLCGYTGNPKMILDHYHFSLVGTFPKPENSKDWNKCYSALEKGWKEIAKYLKSSNK